jgi:hypothetical protein
MSATSSSTPRYSKIPASQHKHLPERPSMEHLKGQAKALLRGFLADDPDAQRRVRRFASELQRPAESPERARPALRLKDAQHVIAREYAAAWKFHSWEDLKSHVDALNNCTDAFIDQQIARMTRSESTSAFNQYRFLGSLGKRILPHLIRAMKTNPNPCVRVNCLSFLDHMDFPPDEEFVSVVTAALRDPVPRVRRMAAHTLCCPRCKTVPAALTPEHVTLLVHLSVADEYEKVRKAAEPMVLMLAEQTHGAVVKETLRQYAASNSEQIRQRAQTVLAKLL